MENKNTLDFFQFLGEITRDLWAIEFLMRTAIARNEWDIDKFPKWNYIRWESYGKYPKSFSSEYTYFSAVAKRFTEIYPNLLDSSNSETLVQLRNALAHWVISKIWENKIEKLIKFKEMKKEWILLVDFELELTPEKLRIIAISISKIRKDIMIVAWDE